MKKAEGLIIKAIGGFYYIETTDNIIECKARGRFRKGDISPMAGDRVCIEYEDAEKKTGVINSIEPRRNFFVRPPIANLDIIVFVVAVCEPAPSFSVLDKLIAIAEYKNIEPIIAVTKGDLANAADICNLYKNCGFEVFNISRKNTDEIPGLLKLLDGKISAFVGNSGVGKSTLLNSINSSLLIETGDISKKLGRGRHTTRQVCLYKLKNGYIADTPGFSTVEFEKYDIIKKEELARCFREFAPFTDKCKFSDCAHINEKGCGICEAVKNGEISESRHRCYVEMYNKAKEYKEWEHRK